MKKINDLSDIKIKVNNNICEVNHFVKINKNLKTSDYTS